MHEVLKTLKTRGYWKRRIRPTSYVKDLASLRELEEAIQGSSVDVRGWSFPHFSIRERPVRGYDYVEHGLNWDFIVEYWKAFKSGQFIAFDAMWGEWRDQSDNWPPTPDWKPGLDLGVEDAVFRLVELYTFASRWARALSVNSSIVIEVELCGIAKRSLFSGRRPIRLGMGFVADQQDWSFKREYELKELCADPRRLAVAPAISLFEQFHWDVQEDQIRDIQNELRG